MDILSTHEECIEATYIPALKHRVVDVLRAPIRTGKTIPGKHLHPDLLVREALVRQGCFGPDFYKK